MLCYSRNVRFYAHHYAEPSVVINRVSNSHSPADYFHVPVTTSWAPRYSARIVRFGLGCAASCLTRHGACGDARPYIRRSIVKPSRASRTTGRVVLPTFVVTLLQLKAMSD